MLLFLRVHYLCFCLVCFYYYLHALDTPAPICTSTAPGHWKLNEKHHFKSHEQLYQFPLAPLYYPFPIHPCPSSLSIVALSLITLYSISLQVSYQSVSSLNLFSIAFPNSLLFHLIHSNTFKPPPHPVELTAPEKVIPTPRRVPPMAEADTPLALRRQMKLSLAMWNLRLVKAMTDKIDIDTRTTETAARNILSIIKQLKSICLRISSGSNTSCWDKQKLIKQF